MPTVIKYNFINGTVQESPLSAGATTLVMTGNLINLPTIASPQIVKLTIDPTGTDTMVGSSPEVVYITAYTHGAGSATIARGKEGTTATAHTRGTIIRSAPTAQDFGPDFKNVMDKAYGARGDGSTDDSAAIQAAHDDMVAGDTLYFPTPSSYYKLGSLIYWRKNNFDVLGEDQWAVILRGGLSGGLVYIGTGDAPTGGINVNISKLTLYQTYSGATAHSILWANGQNMNLDHVTLKTDGSAAASSSYFVNYSITAGNTSGLHLRTCTLWNLASLTTIQVSGIVWRANDLIIDDCDMINVNNPIVPTSDCNKSYLTYTNNRELATSHDVNAEGPDLWNWSYYTVTGNRQANLIVSGDTTRSQGGMLIEAGGPGNFAGVSHQGVVANNVVRGGPVFIISDGNSSTNAAMEKLTVIGNDVDKVRTSLPNDMEITGPTGTADGLLVTGNYMPSGIRFPGTAITAWTNCRIENSGKVYMPASTNAVESSRIPADTVDRFSRDAAGKITWGSGSATGDVTLYRNAVDVLASDDSFRAAGSTHRFGTGALGASGAYADIGDQGDASNAYMMGAGTGSNIGVRLRPKGTGSVGFEENAGTLQVYTNSTALSSGDTALLLRYHNGTTTTAARVLLGAADSGGSGYKLLRVAN